MKMKTKQNIKNGLSNPEAESSNSIIDANDIRIVEALIFASSKPVSEKFITQHLSNSSQIKVILEKLRSFYTGRGIELRNVSNKWFFRTSPDLGEYLKIEKIVPKKLSRAATETLAIIAYHQPITRAEIEEIRGVMISRGTLDLLLEEGWIRPRGRKKVPGRPLTWGTTNEFLDHFGLESLSDLPGIDELKAAGLLDSQPKNTLSDDNTSYNANLSVLSDSK